MNKSDGRQIMRYGIVGVAGVTTDALIYANLICFGCPTNAAKTISVLISVVLAYVANTFWTFQARSSSVVLMRFCIIYAASIVVNVMVNSLAVHTLRETSRYAYYVAFICATGWSAVISFSGLRIWVYRQ